MALPTIKMAPVDWLWIGLLSVMWGSSFIFIEIALGAFPPLTLVALRLSISAAALLAWLTLTGRMPRLTRERCIAVAVLGLLNNALPFLLISWGQTGIGASLASIFNATTPLFGILVAHAFTQDDRITASRLFALLTGFAGVVVLMGGVSPFDAGFWPSMACLCASLFYGFGGVYGRRLSRLGLEPGAASAGQFVASLLIIAPLALAIDRPWTLPAPGIQAWLAISSLALVSSALGYLIFFRVLARSGSTNVLLVTFLVPVSAVLMATAFLGERPEFSEFAGMALIFAGLAVADGRILAWLAERLAGNRRGPKLGV